MEFSEIVLQAREKEFVKQKSLIIRCAIASIVLHIMGLTLGINQLWVTKNTQSRKEPIKITVIELPATAKKQPDKNIKNNKNKNNEQKTAFTQQASTSLSQNSLAGNPIQLLPLSSHQQQSVYSPKSSNFSNNKSPKQSSRSTLRNLSPSRTSVRNIVEDIQKFTASKTRQKYLSQSVLASKLTKTSLNPTVTPSKTEVFTQSEPSPAKTEVGIKQAEESKNPLNSQVANNNSTSPSSYERLRSLLNPKPGNNPSQSEVTQVSTTTGAGNGNHANSRGSEVNRNGKIAGNTTVNSMGVNVGKGTGNRVSNGINNGDTKVGTSEKTPGKKPEVKNVAVAPKPPKFDNTGSKLNSVDCQRCNIKYPERARKLGIEGNPEVKVDYDAQGRVTKVILSRSSGSDELDNALIEQARNFKLKPREEGKQGVRVSANFAIEGSRRHRELRDRQKKRRQREIAAKKQDSSVANPQQDNSRNLRSRNKATTPPNSPSRYKVNRSEYQGFRQNTNDLRRKLRSQSQRMKKGSPSRETGATASKFQRLRNALQRDRKTDSPSFEENPTK